MDERLRVPVDDSYVQSLGRAAYVFAGLEWNAVWCCHRMKPNYIAKLGKKTAGGIARDLSKLAKRRPEAVRASWIEVSAEFEDLVELRNKLMHAKPSTSKAGQQRLSSPGGVWEPEMIDDAADKFARCSMKLNLLLHTELKPTP